jgi:hypothetical protein
MPMKKQIREQNALPMTRALDATPLNTQAFLTSYH